MEDSGGSFEFQIKLGDSLLTRNVLQELASITDASVEAALRQADTSAGKYVNEDPSLAAIQRVVGRDR